MSRTAAAARCSGRCCLLNLVTGTSCVAKGGEGRQQKTPHLLQAGHYAGPSLQLLRDVAVGEGAQRRRLLQPLQVGVRVQPRARHRRPAYEEIERLPQKRSVNRTCKSQNQAQVLSAFFNVGVHSTKVLQRSPAKDREHCRNCIHGPRPVTLDDKLHASQHQRSEEASRGLKVTA